jgi:hypothetical protein
MEVSAVNFEKTQNQDKIIGFAESSFYKSAGISVLLFNSEAGGSIGLTHSIKTDEEFVLHLYRQFEKWITFQISKVTGKYKFKIFFPDITYFNKSEKFDEYLKAAQFGMPKSLVACSMGLTPNDFMSLTNWENEIDLISELRPLQSSHTSNGADEGGRPSKKVEDLKETGLKTRDTGGNDNRVK